MGSSKTPQPNNLAINDATARIAVAFSGGLDSTVLLHTTVAAHGSENVIALHVNHGLQDIADDWVIHCANVAKKFDVSFDFRLLTWDQSIDQLSNIEAKAREARYEALAQMCEHHQATHLLLGHHQDDQAETVILQLLRGAGLPGLSGMGSQRVLEQSQVRIWRPFLDLTRAELEAYAHEYHLDWIEDPTNQDEHFTRNLIRLRLMPILDKIQPQFRKNLSRTASHMAQAQNLLDQLADIDLNVMSTESGLDLTSLLALRYEDTARANNALRRWLFLQDLSMPSDERLTAWWVDLEKLRDASDHQLQWVHDGKHVRIWRKKITIIEATSSLGYWEFRVIDPESDQLGLSRTVYDIAIANQLIVELERKGGEKIRIHPQQSRKTLKNIFQEFDIPPWQRFAKVLFLDKEVLAVAGVGLNVDLMTTYGPRLVPVYIKESE